MPITHKNRKNKIYYLHQGITKTGKTKYHFSMKDKGNLADRIPDGYEIYENPTNAQVFLRKALPKAITDIEEFTIKSYLKKLNNSDHYKMDIRGKVITIFEPNQNADEMREIFGGFINTSFLRKGLSKESAIETIIASSTQYHPVLRFTLEDESSREFIAERYCFKGSIDDWIHVGGPGLLAKLAPTFIERLGTEAFYELY